MVVLLKPYEFQWDTWNSGKNFKKHGVSDGECEEAFFDEKRKILRDIIHSGDEERYILLGKTKKGIVLFIAFTIRKHTIRIISARPLNHKESHLYEKKDTSSKI